MTSSIDEMRAAIANLSGRPAAVPETPTSEVLALVQTPQPPMTEAQIHAQFRTDMRQAGLAVYDVLHEMCGIAHEGPAVNVRDPLQATRATKLTLASLALSTNVWRMYPVMYPLDV